MKKDIYEVLGKRFEIEVNDDQVEIFQNSCDRLNKQFDSFSRLDLHKAEVSALLNVMVELVQQEVEIEKINNQLTELLNQ